MRPVIVFCAVAAGIAALVGASGKDEHDLLNTMQTWKQAMLHRDAAALDKLYHPDLTYSHSSGKTETKQEAIDAVTKGNNYPEKIDMAGLTVRVYGNTALVKGNLTIANNNNGTKQTLQLSVLHVFIKGPQGWQLVARQSTRLNPS